MIACLGWGSLVWDLDGLPVEKLAEGEVGDWKPDGPMVAVEFVRQSQDGRLTLVLDNTAEPVPSLWARMTVDTLDAAVEALATREGPKSNGKRKPLSKPERDIGRWTREQAEPKNIPGLVVWAISRDIKHVIWTELKPKFKNQPCPLTKDQAVAYLSKLPHAERVKAEEYVRLTRPQINTAYRRHIVRCLGPEWEV